ncbi:MAG: M20/M25/M40 family metallo-hydrolase [Firmicutes bacterium]|nr:M20/M25/M40 family metallo-hydrolase [Bacillota bacterium]
MATRESVKHMLYHIVDYYAPELVTIGTVLFSKPEYGFFEFATQRYMMRFLRELGVAPTTVARTGFVADIGDKKSTSVIALVADMDAVCCPDHPRSDAQTGAAHACGHHAQLVHLLGVCWALKVSGLLESLHGRVRLIGAPAEEFIQLDERLALRESGAIHFLSGKQELIHLGIFDEVQAVLSVHVAHQSPEPQLFLSDGAAGFELLRIRFPESRDPRTPSSLYRLNLLIRMLQLADPQGQRLRWHVLDREEDDTEGVLTLDIYFVEESRQAIQASIDQIEALVAQLEGLVHYRCIVERYPGYWPLRQSKDLHYLFAHNAVPFIGKAQVQSPPLLEGSTDLGDLSQWLPVAQPFWGGVSGHAHQADFDVVDKEAVYLWPIKTLLGTIVDLLWDNAAILHQVVARFQPTITKQGYLQEMERQYEGISRRLPGESGT